MPLVVLESSPKWPTIATSYRESSYSTIPSNFEEALLLGENLSKAPSKAKNLLRKRRD